MADGRDEVKWWVYIIRCGDDSFYTGIAINVERRLKTHQDGRGARYTRGRGPLQLWWTSGPWAHADALKEERRIKRLSHRRKVSLGGMEPSDHHTS